MAYVYTKLAADTFKRPNENPVNPAMWSPVSTNGTSPCQIVSNELEPTAGKSNAQEISVAWPVNQWAQLQVDECMFSDDSDDATVLLGLRASVQNNTYVAFEVDGPLGPNCNVVIFSDNGGYTVYLGTGTGGPGDGDAVIALYAGDSIRLEVYNGMVSAYTIHNGVSTQILAPTLITPAIGAGNPMIVLYEDDLSNLPSDVQVSNFASGSMYAIGDTMDTLDINSIFPATSDLGHTCDGIVYSGTLAWQGRVGIIRPNTGLGDVLFPTIHSGESNNYCRALAADFTYSPNNGDRVQFIILRTSAGDRLAKAITLQ